MQKVRITGCIMLVITAVIWGSAFVAQSTAMEFLEPFTFMAVRFLLGSAVLTPIIFLTYRYRKKRGVSFSHSRKNLLLGGLACGTVLFISASAQQVAIEYTTVGKCSFITAMYIVLVPIAGRVILGKKMSPLVAVSVALAVVGLYLLCIKKESGINKGDLLTLVCAVMFTFHILVVDYFCPKTDGVQLSCLQFLVCSVWSFITALIFEPPIKLHNIYSAGGSILFCGLLSCGVAYTLQILGQQRTPPAAASIIMSLESVFGALAGALVLGQSMTAKEICGCLLMFTAVILAQLPVEIFKAQIKTVEKN